MGGNPCAGNVPLTANLEIRQGSFVVVVGKLGAGKSTLLKLLSDRIFPTAGEVFVPPHCRILHVPAEAHFMNKCSLLANMRLGVRGSNSDGDVDRVAKIMRRVGLPERVLKML